MEAQYLSLVSRSKARSRKPYILGCWDHALQANLGNSSRDLDLESGFRVNGTLSRHLIHPVTDMKCDESIERIPSGKL